MNAPANIPRNNEPFSEQWQRKALDCVDAEAAAQLLEETKSAFLAELMAERMEEDPKLAVSKAETLVKASPEWRAWVEKMVRTRKLANRLRVERDYLRMRFQEWISQDANHRAAARM